jgi:hypothetical protein
MEKRKKGLFIGPSFFGGRLERPFKESAATGNLLTVSDTVGLFGFPVDRNNGKFFTRHWG